VKDSDIKITADMRSQLKNLGSKHNKIDLSDIPEMLDWSNALVGKFYRPIKKPVNLRLDSDVLLWFQSRGKKYQTRINEALRKYMMEQCGNEKNA
jgi:uncharacterized protein (DUF4415 family)